MTQPTIAHRPAILVIDDHDAILRVVERALGGRYDVRCVGTPEDAVRVAREFRPELAICDLRLPGMDGFALIERMRATHPDLDVIIMTGDVAGGSDKPAAKAIRERAFYFIAKPFDNDLLCALVERWSEIKRLRTRELEIARRAAAQEANSRYVARLERDMNRAKILQEAMLPPRTGTFGSVTFSSDYHAHDDLGGDFFDYIGFGESSVAVVVADVMGHGVSAALLTAAVKAAFRSSIDAGYDPLTVVKRVSEVVAGFAPQTSGDFEITPFVTMFSARLDLVNHTLEYVNAGHPPGMVWSSGGEPVSLHGTGPLVMDNIGPWEKQTIALSAPCQLLLCTDGLIEVRNQGEQFAKKLPGILRESKLRDHALIQHILREIRAFCEGRRVEDDLALITLSLDGNPAR